MSSRLPAGLSALAARQDGVLTTAQCVAAGVDRDWVSRQVGAGAWQRLHIGVMVTYSGPTTWRSRARGGLLYAGTGAVLSHWSAAHLHGFVAAPPRLVHVSIPERRRVQPSAGVRIVRRRELSGFVVGRLPVSGEAPTVLDLLETMRSDDDAVGLLCDAVRAGVWPAMVLDAVAERRRMRHRSLVLELLGEVREGIESPLELRYHRDVERRHGLPRSVRQVRQLLDGRWIRADCLYTGLGVRVELDGALAHPGGRTDSDTWRDNAVLIERGELTLRYRWFHVRCTPCAAAEQVVRTLQSRGWTGSPYPCSPRCPVSRRH